MALASLSLLLATRAGAAGISEDFSSDPLRNGWQVSGVTNLFQWDSTNKNLRVTWDSSQSNSYFYHSLGTIVTRNDDFTIAFDLRVDDAGPNTNGNKPYTFPLAVSFLNLREATQTNFERGTGANSPDLAEFAYFYDDNSGYGATIWPTFTATNGLFNYNSSSDFYVGSLTLGDWYRISMNYTMSNHTMITTLLSGSNNFTIIDPLATSFTDFRLDTLSISSYSDVGQPLSFAGSVLAHGAVDNFVVTIPPPPAQNFTGTPAGGAWRGQFLSQSNWLYTLQRTADFQTWTDLSPATVGNATNLFLLDTNPPAPKAFYRVRAARP